MAKNEPIRLQKLLSQCGIASRRKAEQMIIDGHVKVNGKTAQLGDKVRPTDKVFVMVSVCLPTQSRLTAILCSISREDLLLQ